MATRKEPPTTDTSSVSAMILSFFSTNSGIAKEQRWDLATSTVLVAVDGIEATLVETMERPLEDRDGSAAPDPWRPGPNVISCNPVN